MKKAFKKFIVTLLGWQTRRLRKRNHFKVIAVVGSSGKTSTKLAIAQMLVTRFNVRTQEGNYNDLLTVPLVFFGQKNPETVTNPLPWLRIFISNEIQIAKTYPYDIVVVELGTDGPGQIKEFAGYLTPDVAVVTAIAPEHMEFFKDIQAVAKEELSVSEFSKCLIVNKDLLGSFTSDVKDASTYGISDGDVYLSKYSLEDKGYELDLVIENQKKSAVKTSAFSVNHLYSILAAILVAKTIGMTPEHIMSGVSAIRPPAGRMRLLDGINDSIIIDDTYNASPEAMKMALDTLYNFPGNKKIALLGSMNELGDESARYHTEVGKYCHPQKIDVVITLGKEANDNIALAAASSGCKVLKSKTPQEAADTIRPHMTKGTVLLAKGSQNGVFAEEAIRRLLARQEDSKLLVRQSKAWLKKKRQQFL